MKRVENQRQGDDSGNASELRAETQSLAKPGEGPERYWVGQKVHLVFFHEKKNDYSFSGLSHLLKILLIDILSLLRLSLCHCGEILHISPVYCVNELLSVVP